MTPETFYRLLDSFGPAGIAVVVIAVILLIVQWARWWKNNPEPMPGLTHDETEEYGQLYHIRESRKMTREECDRHAELCMRVEAAMNEEYNQPIPGLTREESNEYRFLCLCSTSRPLDEWESIRVHFLQSAIYAHAHGGTADGTR